MQVKTKEELRALYGWPSGRAKDKVLPALEKHAKHFISLSPFFLMSTFNSNGEADASPRGGNPGFVKVLDDKTLLIPDAKGNNRVDSLTNIVETGRVGCLFLIPGIDETLRINGMAIVSTDIDLLKVIENEKHPPISCIKITINEMFLHCAKALMRSDLWGESNRQSRPEFPTMGTMLNAQLKIDSPKSETQSEMLARYKKDL